MRVAILLAGLVSLASPGSAQQAAEPAPEEEVLVTGVRRPPTPREPPIEIWRRHCLDPNRQEGRSRLPHDDPLWAPLDAGSAARWGVDDAESAWMTEDLVRGTTLVLKAERFARSDGLAEERCTLVVLGGRNHERLVGELSRLWGGPGTQRHVGHHQGMPRLPGWRQWLWTGSPDRKSSSWRVVQASGAARAAGTWTVVTHPSFYDQHRYVFGDLKIRQSAARPVAMLTLGNIWRD